MHWTAKATPIALLATLGCTSEPSSDGETSTTDATTDVDTDTDADADASDTETDTGEPACPAQTAAELMDCVDPARYADDLEFVADIRVPGTTHWQAVQDMCFDRLAELGYAVELHDYGTGINVLGTRPGTDAADETVIIGAHYDHIPECTGADDNATGVAAALEAARVLAEVPTSRTIVIACWDEEELGLIGSDAHAQATVDDGDTLSAVFALDMIGYANSEPDTQTVPAGFDLLFPEQYANLEANEFRGDFLFWVTDLAMQPIGEAAVGFSAQVGLPELGATLDDDLKKSDLLADLRRSDHASFWDRDLPGMFFNDTANFRYSAYHCADGDDALANVDTDFAVKVTQVVTASAATAAEMP